MISQSNHMMSVAKRWCWSRNGHTQNWLNTGVTTKIILKSSTGPFTLHDESTWIWWIRIGMCLLSCYYVKPLCTSFSKIFRPENCRNPTTLLHWHESHFNSESRKWNNSSLSKILTLELQHKHPWTTLIEHSLFFFCRRVWKWEVQIPKDSCLWWDTIWKLKLLPTEDDQVSEYINQMTRSN